MLDLNLCLGFIIINDNTTLVVMSIYLMEKEKVFMKNVLVISTSLRAGSNSEVLAEKFAEGAKSVGNQVEFISLKGKKINFCIGCLSCQKTKECVIKDDSNEIVHKMQNADVIVFATPIYYYEMSGQMKTLLDRGNPLFVSDYNFKDIYLIATCADGEKQALDRAISGLGGWIECFDGVELKGVIYGVGADEPNQTKSMPKLLDDAYNMGKSIK